MKKLPDIKHDFSGWYNEVIYDSELVDHAPVKGCMVIRPYGYAIWENIKNVLDARIKATGHQNAAFPLLIPESFLKKEAQHVAGFAPELAVVTHAGGKQLEEPLVIRPTSETIIHYMFAQWLRSWRDLPIKINQWANVVRWEMRTRPFLRTSEFFWQEGHTAHETEKEATEEVHTMLQEYVNLVQDYMAVPVIAGFKTAQERFAGADITTTIEGIMPDGKALQMGTSHLISQSFARAFEMKYQDREGKESYPFLTSWGASTRLIGGLIMMHGDEKGLVLPPKIAPIQVVIIPIFRTGIDQSIILNAAQKIQTDLQNKGLRVHLDIEDGKTPGAKFFKWELKGVPVRVEIGPKDIENNHAMVADRIGSGKKAIQLSSIADEIDQLLVTMQTTLFERAQAKIAAMRHSSNDIKEFGPQLEEGKFFQTSWCEKAECEAKLKQYKASIRCIIEGLTYQTCFVCKEQSSKEVIVARSY